MKNGGSTGKQRKAARKSSKEGTPPLTGSKKPQRVIDWTVKKEGRQLDRKLKVQGGAVTTRIRDGIIKNARRQ